MKYGERSWIHMKNTNQSPPDSQLPLRIGELSERGIASPATLWRWKRRGLKTHKIGGVVLIYPSDLEEFIRRNGEARQLPSNSSKEVETARLSRPDCPKN